MTAPAKTFNTAACPEDRWFLMEAAISMGNIALVKKLLKEGVAVNQVAKEKHTLLGMALYYQYGGIARLLIEAGADVHQPTGYGRPALGMAAWIGDAATVRELVSHGADLHEKDRYGATPLQLAATKNHVETATTLSDALAREKTWLATEKACAAAARKQLIHSSIALQHDLRRPKLKLRRKP